MYCLQFLSIKQELIGFLTRVLQIMQTTCKNQISGQISIAIFVDQVKINKGNEIERETHWEDILCGNFCAPKKLTSDSRFSSFIGVDYWHFEGFEGQFSRSVEKKDQDNQNLHWKLGQQAPSFGFILAYLETRT